LGRDATVILSIYYNDNSVPVPMQEGKR
jgi:hypothetical protein